MPKGTANCSTVETVESAEITPSVHLPIIPVLADSDTIICSNDPKAIVLSVSDKNGEAASWQWKKGTTLVGTASELSVSAAGIYNVSAVNTICPSGIAAREITEVSLSVLLETNGEDVEEIRISEGTNLDLSTVVKTNSTTENSYAWSENNLLRNETGSSIVVTPMIGTLYKIVTENGKCKASDSVRVITSSPLSITPLITLNNNGKSDTWIIEGLELYSSHKVTLYNNWGNIIYETNDYLSNPWNGKNPSSGVELPEGTYYYVIELVGTDSKQEQLVGYITLMK